MIAEIALVLVLFSDASRVGLKALKNNLSTRLLTIGLPITIILGVIIATLLFPGIPWWVAGIIGAALAPTDAALGQIVVQNKNVPERIRSTIEIESGLNDGGSVPFLLVFIAIGLAAEAFKPSGYFIQVAFQQIGFGIIVGSRCWTFRWLVGFKSTRQRMDHSRIPENSIFGNGNTYISNSRCNGRKWIYSSLYWWFSIRIHC